LIFRLFSDETPSKTTSASLKETTDEKQKVQTRYRKNLSSTHNSHLYRSLDHTRSKYRSPLAWREQTTSHRTSTFYIDSETPTDSTVTQSSSSSAKYNDKNSKLVIAFKKSLSLSTESLNIFYQKQETNAETNFSQVLNENYKYLNAAKKFEEILGSELSSRLICDNTSSLRLFSDIKGDRNTMAYNNNNNNDNLKISNDRNSTDSNEVSLSDLSASKSSSSSISPNLTAANNICESLESVNELLDKKKQQKLDEYYRIEEKQAKLLKILANSVYRPLLEENKQQRLCDTDEMMKVFYVVAELEQLATLVHEQVAIQIKTRIETEWSLKPFFGDILTTYYYYYRVYKAVLKRYPTCQITLSILLKKPKFSACLKRLLDAESLNLEKITRLDMLLDRIVDLPRRSIQLLESYIKLLEPGTKEFDDIKKVLNLFTDIFESSNDALNKMNNFQNCYELQYMIEQPQREKDRIDIIDPNFPNRQLIKQGPLYKVAKRNGELILRHLALFTDILLVCKCDNRFTRKLKLNYKLPTSKLKLIENSNETNELMFRIVSSDQNNEFKADKKKDKDDWLKAFRKCKDIEIVSAGDGTTDEVRQSYHPSKIIENDKIGLIPPIWIKDGEQTTCSGCNETFTAFRRRHHCRTCGQIYCSSCCSSYIAVKFNDFKKRERVCRECYDILLPMYEEYAKSVEDSSILLPPEPDSHLTNKTIATVNDFLKNITSNNAATSAAITTLATMINGNSQNNGSSNNSNNNDVNSSNINNNNNTNGKTQAIEGNNVNLNKEFCPSNSSIDTLTKELDQVFNARAINITKNRKVIRRKRVDSGENLSSSPLNDEQLNFIKPFLDIDERSNDSLSSSSDSEDLEVSMSKNFEEINFNKTDNNKTNDTDENKLLRPKVPIKPNLNEILKNDIMRHSDKELLHRIPDKTTTQSATNFRKQSASNFTKEVICADFGYLCKIPIVPNESKSSENLTKEAEPTSSISSSTSWSYMYFTLYSNNTIGVSANNNDTGNPSVIIKLSLFQLKDINETTFGLDVIKNKTPSPERKSSTKLNDLNNNNNEHVSDDNFNNRPLANKLTGMDSNVSIKSKLKMFETNYELRFTNKLSKYVNKLFLIIFLRSLILALGFH